MAIGPVDSSFYADPSGLAALKRQAATQSPEALREAARQFESLFTSMMLKSMRDATPENALFGSDQQDFYQDMFDQQLAVQLSKGKGLGLADMLVRQLMQGAGGVAGTDKASGVQAAADTPRAAVWPPRTQEDFVQSILPAATAAAKALGVEPATVIAHAALETGWGKSMPAGNDGRPSFNLFGIKAGGGWSGEVARSATQEFEAGGMRRVDADFRSYASPEASLGDYVKLLRSSPRYAAALGTGGDVAGFAQALQKGGYATDPDYAAKLTAVAARLKSHHLLPINQAGSTAA